MTANSDTPYSVVWMDLRAEPIVLSIPAVEKNRYFSVMLCEGNTFNYGYMGSRATGNEAGDYMVVGPDWKGETSPGIKGPSTLPEPILRHRGPAGEMELVTVGQLVKRLQNCGFASCLFLGLILGRDLFASINS